MSEKWLDSDGDTWDRACTNCCNRYNKINEYTGSRLDKCKIKNKVEFSSYENKGIGNGCSDFRTDVWVP